MCKVEKESNHTKSSSKIRRHRCCSNNENDDQDDDDDKLRYYTREEVAKHSNSSNDIWMIYYNQVLDVSCFIHNHPGGAVILTYGGHDITDIFPAFHSKSSYHLIQKFVIGKLLRENNDDEPTKQQQQQQIEFESAYRKLRVKFIKMGLFQPTQSYYYYKFIQIFLLGIFSSWLIITDWDINKGDGSHYISSPTTTTTSTLIHCIGCILMGLFLQQSAWISHDLLHHQVFYDRKYADYWSLIWSNLFEGYSMQWWKNKHSCHHAVTNIEDSKPGVHDGDPDIDTMPIIAWSVKQIQYYFLLYPKSNNSTIVKFLIQYQAYLFAFILPLARLSWMKASLEVAFGLGVVGPSKNIQYELRHMGGLKYPKLERTFIILHYVWVYIVVSNFGSRSLSYAFVLFMIMTTSCGFFLAVVFILGHNAMTLYDNNTNTNNDGQKERRRRRIDFFRLQVSTTRHINTDDIRNIFMKGGLVWFFGAFQNHIDHHLFPTMPRPNLDIAHPYIKSFCKQYNILYHETDTITGIKEVFFHLDTVSKEFVTEFIVDGPGMM